MRLRILLVIAGLLGLAAAVQSVAAATKSAHADIVSAKQPGVEFKFCMV